MGAASRSLGTVTVVLSAVASACSVLTSFDGLTGGSGAADASIDHGRDGVASDGAGADAAYDAGDDDAQDVDGAAPDAPFDAGVDAQAPGLVGYWSFDEGNGTIAHDLSGNGNDGTLFGGATWVAGKVGGAISLDGQSGTVVVNDSASLHVTSDLTVAMWINVDDTINSMRLITKETAWDVKLNFQQPQLSGPTGDAVINPLIPPNTWRHFAFTYSLGQVHGFVDGAETTLKENTFNNNAAMPTGNHLRIGSYEATPPGYFVKGMVDEVRLYNRVLSPAEIAVLAQ